MFVFRFLNKHLQLMGYYFILILLFEMHNSCVYNKNNYSLANAVTHFNWPAVERLRKLTYNFYIHFHPTFTLYKKPYGISKINQTLWLNVSFSLIGWCRTTNQHSCANRASVQLITNIKSDFLHKWHFFFAKALLSNIFRIVFK